MPPRPKVATLLAAMLLAGSARAQLTADRTLLLYNSANPDSLAVRNMYVAARPLVRELDLNDTLLAPGTIARADYLARIRAKLLTYLSGTAGGVPLSQHIIAIATTRGLPSRVEGANEFDISSSWASLEAELAVLHQNLESAGVANLPNRFNGVIRNPFFRVLGTPITNFSRTGITTQRNFSYFSPGAWRLDSATGGDIYLVCRLDAAPSVPGSGGTATALQNVQALLNRSANPRVDPCGVQMLLDEYGCSTHLDDDGLGTLFPALDDFGRTRSIMQGAGYSVTHDTTVTWRTMASLPDQRPLLVFGTYGVNHAISGCGFDPDQGQFYPRMYTFHPASCFVSIESFNGNWMVDQVYRNSQGQVTDFIASGGTFTLGGVAEPFTFAVPDLEMLTQNLYVWGLTFAEAAYTAMPGVSWGIVPVGDPLARVTIGAGGCAGDATGDNMVSFPDLNAVLSTFGQSGSCLSGDVNRDGAVNFADLNMVLSAFGTSC
ncbi:MAG: hypothetical protein AB7G17_06010 [Phycisphaerales bacterium]